MLATLTVNGTTEVLTYDDEPVLVLPEEHGSINDVSLVSGELIVDFDVEELNLDFDDPFNLPSEEEEEGEEDFDDENYDDDEDGLDARVARLTFYVYPIGSLELPEEDWTKTIKRFPNIIIEGIAYGIAAEYVED